VGKTDLLEERIDKLICLPHLGEEVLRLLKGEKEHSSSSRELKNEGGWETARLNILGKRGKVGGETKAKEDFSAEQGLQNKIGRH